MSTETKFSVLFDNANVRERSDVLQRFHRKRLYWKGQRLLNKASVSYTHLTLPTKA